MNKWLHEVEAFPESSLADVQEVLRKRGDAGWALCGTTSGADVTTPEKRKSVTILVFRRLASDNTEAADAEHKDGVWLSAAEAFAIVVCTQPQGDEAWVKMRQRLWDVGQHDPPADGTPRATVGIRPSPREMAEKCMSDLQAGPGRDVMVGRVERTIAEALTLGAKREAAADELIEMCATEAGLDLAKAFASSRASAEHVAARLRALKGRYAIPATATAMQVMATAQECEDRMRVLMEARARVPGPKEAVLERLVVAHQETRRRLHTLVASLDAARGQGGNGSVEFSSAGGSAAVIPMPWNTPPLDEVMDAVVDYGRACMSDAGNVPAAREKVHQMLTGMGVPVRMHDADIDKMSAELMQAVGDLVSAVAWGYGKPMESPEQQSIKAARDHVRELVDAMAKRLGRTQYWLDNFQGQTAASSIRIMQLERALKTASPPQWPAGAVLVSDVMKAIEEHADARQAGMATEATLAKITDLLTGGGKAAAAAAEPVPLPAVTEIMDAARWLERAALDRGHIADSRDAVQAVQELNAARHRLEALVAALATSRGAPALCTGTAQRPTEAGWLVGGRVTRIPPSDGIPADTGRCAICGSLAKVDDQGNLAAHEAQRRGWFIPMMTGGGKMTSEVDADAPLGRCNRCGWPIVPPGHPGCWASNCSMRPMPPERAADATAAPGAAPAAAADTRQTFDEASAESGVCWCEKHGRFHLHPHKNLDSGAASAACSFCGQDTRVMRCTTGANICYACAGLCRDVLAEGPATAGGGATVNAKDAMAVLDRMEAGIVGLRDTDGMAEPERKAATAEYDAAMNSAREMVSSLAAASVRVPTPETKAVVEAINEVSLTAHRLGVAVGVDEGEKKLGDARTDADSALWRARALVTALAQRQPAPAAVPASVDDVMRAVRRFEGKVRTVVDAVGNGLAVYEREGRDVADARDEIRRLVVAALPSPADVMQADALLEKCAAICDAAWNNTQLVQRREAATALADAIRAFKGKCAVWSGFTYQQLQDALNRATVSSHVSVPYVVIYRVVVAALSAIGKIEPPSDEEKRAQLEAQVLSFNPPPPGGTKP